MCHICEFFQTPKGVVCKGRKVTKPVPTLPNFYHYRQEIIQAGKTQVFQADVSLLELNKSFTNCLNIKVILRHNVGIVHV